MRVDWPFLNTKINLDLDRHVARGILRGTHVAVEVETFRFQSRVQLFTAPKDTKALSSF